MEKIGSVTVLFKVVWHPHISVDNRLNNYSFNKNCKYSYLREHH